MKRTIFIIFFMTCFFAEIIYAEKFRAEGFHYYKDIEYKIVHKNLKMLPVYGRINLDEKIVKYSGEHDLFITYKDRPLPCFTRNIPVPHGKKGYKIPKIIYRKKTGPRSQIVLLKLPDIPQGTEYIALKVHSYTRYEANVSVKIGDKPNNLWSIGSRMLYKYKGEKANTLRFNSKNNRYIRLSFYGGGRFKFLSAQYAPVKRKSEIKIEIPVSELSINHNNHQNYSNYFYENEMKRKIHKIVLQFKEKKYQRLLLIKELRGRSKSFKYFMNLSISSKKGDDPRQIVDLYRTTSRPLKIVLKNRDDKPLNLEKLIIYSPLEELVFELPQVEQVKADAGNNIKLKLYYGNKYAKRYRYDITSTYDYKLKHVKLKAGIHKENKNFGYSILEPPLSSWVVRLIFLIGLLGLSYPLYKVLLNYGKDMEKENADEIVS